MSQSTTSRKRSASTMSLSDSQDTYQPDDIVNPLSHTPSVLTQMRLAGFPETEVPPSNTQPKFPHRAWQDPDAPAPTRRGGARPLESDSDEQGDGDDDNEDDDGSKRRPRKKDGEKKAKYSSEKTAFRPLVAAIYGFLDKGDVANAKRAFGILAKSHVHGKPVDIRRNHYWALGAEILMRENGGDDAENAQEYPAGNVHRVREYFQDLIQRFPYNYKQRSSISAVDFWPALLGYEVYQAHARQTASLERLERETQDWEEDSWQEPSIGAGGDEMMTDGEVEFRADSRDRRVRQERDRIRLQTLDDLRMVASRMDGLLEERPYSTNPELLRLRGMVSLYIGDLLIPAYTQNNGEMAEARARRDVERNSARSWFQKMVEHRGRPDAFILEMLASTEDDDGPLLPAFSSLPIREYQTAG